MMHSMARKHVLVRLTVILFWVTVWSVFAAYLPDVLFAGPIDTLRCLPVSYTHLCLVDNSSGLRSLVFWPVNHAF